jgi:hypothetical protein
MDVCCHPSHDVLAIGDIDGQVSMYVLGVANIDILFHLNAYSILTCLEFKLLAAVYFKSAALLLTKEK